MKLRDIIDVLRESCFWGCTPKREKAKLLLVIQGEISVHEEDERIKKTHNHKEHYGETVNR